MSLKGKVALVTGSTSGIGQGIAQALAAAGADIMLNGFGDAEQIEALRSAMAAQCGVRVGHSPADMTKPEQIADMVARTEAMFGAVDVLVNNSRHPVRREYRRVSCRTLGRNHRGEPLCGVPRHEGGDPRHEAARLGGGLSTSPRAHGLVASAQKVAYVAAKHAVVGMTKVAAIELANHGVTVNAICPGWVLTPLVQRQLEARATQDGADLETQKHRFLTEKQPMEQFSTPEQIGGLAVFLCSESAKQLPAHRFPSTGAGWRSRTPG